MRLRSRLVLLVLALAVGDRPGRVLEAVGKNLLAEPQVSGVVVNSRDVTERRRAEDIARQSAPALKPSRAQRAPPLG